MFLRIAVDEDNVIISQAGAQLPTHGKTRVALAVVATGRGTVRTGRLIGVTQQRAKLLHRVDHGGAGLGKRLTL